MKDESQHSILRLRWKLLAGLIVLLAELLAIFEFSHRYSYGHFVSYGLRVDVIARESYIGIPGQTKMYEPHLFNFTFLPVSLEACDFVDDTLSPGAEYPYAVQKLDTVSKDWQTVAAVGSEDFAHQRHSARLRRVLFLKGFGQEAQLKLWTVKRPARETPSQKVT